MLARAPASALRARASTLVVSLLVILSIAGCSSDEPPEDAPGGECAGKPGQPGTQILSITSQGVERTFRMHVPASYRSTRATALALGFHGFSRSGEQHEQMSGMSLAAEEHGFIVAYPDGLGGAWNGGTCCTTTSDDVAFTRDLVTEVSLRYCIDQKRVFAAGISNGGLFSNRLACEAADLVAAVAPIASGIGVTCQPTRPVAHLAFAGSTDPLVPYGVTELEVSEWRKFNGCSDVSEQVYSQGDATCLEWSDCLEGASVRFCTIDGGGHTWPGSPEPLPWGKTSVDIDASKEMFDFFERHPMP